MTAQCACVIKLSNDVVITKHSLVDQKYCPDVSKQMSQHIHGDCISSAITHTAPLCNPSHQTDGYVHMTLHRHPTTHDFGDGNNAHEVFPAYLGDGTIGNCNSKRPHGLPVTHFDGESNKEEVHSNIEELHGGERDARYTLRKLGDRLDVPVVGTVKEKETSI